MKLELHRFEFTDASSIGRLIIDCVPFCFTLEDTDRALETNPEAKVYGKSAIPRGTYRVMISFSQRFKKELPILLNVPNFEGVRIHPGNGPEDTEGCILVGNSWRRDWVGNSRATFANLMEQLEEAYERGEVIELEIK